MGHTFAKVSVPVVEETMRKTMDLFRQVATNLNQQFLNKEELTRLLVISTIAGEHLVIIGPPGTAKSAIIRSFAQLIDAKYFEYLLTRFTEPNEIFGPVDIQVFRQGTYRRRTDGMLPTAEIVFCDEIFKANSAILNSLLTILNERKFSNGNILSKVPLLSMFGASNEIPNDDSLEAIYDRFLLRVYSDNLEGFHFQGLIDKGIRYEQARLSEQQGVLPILNSGVLHQLHTMLPQSLNFTPEFISQYKNLVFQVRNEGISLSDRRVVKLLKLFAASALFDGRNTADAADFMILKHIWNNLDQREILRDIIDPVLESHYERNPSTTRPGSAPSDIGSLANEVRLIEDLLSTGDPISDIQLFSQLRNLNNLKQALLAHSTSGAKEIVGRIDQLLESIFSSSKFE